MEPYGISAYMDWSLLVPCLFGNVTKPPRLIFVHNHMLPHFVESTLYFMDPSYRFILITGGTDMTIPRQIDQRYRQSFRGFGGNDGGKFYKTLLESPHLIHWYAENHDLSHPKLSTLPTGMSTGGDPDSRTDYPRESEITRLSSRPLQITLSDRVRSGTGQWALRAQVKEMCMKLPDICHTPGNNNNNNNNGEGIEHATYIQEIVSRPFLACVRGGGLDPSPKAWEAILLGVVPIIQVSIRVYSIILVLYCHCILLYLKLSPSMILEQLVR
jgi:hypothetical protein